MVKFYICLQVTMLTSVYANIEQPQKIKTESPIDKPVEVNEDLNRPVVPESCKNTTYCEEVINYPEEAVSNLIATLGKGVSVKVDKLVKPDTPAFAQRASLDGNIKLCDGNDTVIYPRWGVDYDGRSHYIVNGKSQKEKIQGFGIQFCTKTDCQCNNVVIAFEKKYRGRCKQFYIYRPATAFESNGSNLRPYPTHIKLPFYCECIAEFCKDNCDDNQKNKKNIPAP